MKAVQPDRLPPLSRVMLAFADHGGCATDDQIVSHLGDQPVDVIERCLANLLDVGYAERHGERRGWARRPRPLYRLTDAGRAVVADIHRPPPVTRRRKNR